MATTNGSDSSGQAEKEQRPLHLESTEDEEEAVNTNVDKEEDAVSEASSEYGVKTVRQPEPQCRVTVRYVLACTVAVFFAAYAPDTKLWRDVPGSTTERSLDVEKFAELIAVFIITLVSFFIVRGSDPGYLSIDTVEAVCQEDGLTLLGYEQEQNMCLDEHDVSLDEANGESVMRRASSRVGGDPLAPPSQIDKSTEEEDALIFHGTRRKVCHTCELAPPLRSHHCKVCKKCVATFDHHCMFIGTCIGERNHCRFWWFLLCQGLGFYVCCSIVHSSKLGFRSLLQNPTWDAALVLVAKIYLYPLTAVALTILLTHTVLAVTNMTTFECGKGPTHIDYLRGTRETDLPFSRGFDHNLRLFCCQRDGCCQFLMGEPEWKPILWQTPGKIIRDSEDWWEHPWQNKYYSCC